MLKNKCVRACYRLNIGVCLDEVKSCLVSDTAMAECEGEIRIEYATATFTLRLHCRFGFYRNKNHLIQLDNGRRQSLYTKYMRSRNRK